MNLCFNIYKCIYSCMIHTSEFIYTHICRLLKLTHLHIQRHTDIDTHILTFTHVQICILTCTCQPIQQTYTIGNDVNTLLHMLRHSHTYAHTHRGAFSHTNNTEWHILTSIEMFTHVNCYISMHIYTHNRHTDTFLTH